MTVGVVEPDARLRRVAGMPSVRRNSMRLGGTTVSYVPDGAVRLPPRGWFPDTTGRTWEKHREYLDSSGQLVASIGALLVENGDRAMLIDAGFGPHSLPPDPLTPRGTIHGGALLSGLAELGRHPAEIESVAVTHLHPDHLGWAWYSPPEADPVFANAEYLVAKPEWAARESLEKHGNPDEIAALAARVRTVSDGEEIFPGVRVRVAGGHTPGHTEYVIDDGGKRLIAFGDAMHTSLQIDHPEWTVAVDHDPILAIENRHRLVTELAEPDTIGFGVHFADVVFGRVRRNADGPAWQPLDD